MPANPFALLGLPARFDLDPADLHRRYIAASAANHPDRFTNALDQADAAGRAAAINEAHRVLKDPEQRADALLALLGGPAKDQDKSLPPDLLAELMERREQMDESLSRSDRATLRELAGWAQTQRQQHLQRIAALFAQASATEPPSRLALLRQVRRDLNALRYFQRMTEQVP